MKRVICFGDSLTHGSVPYGNGSTADRYPKDVRWTGILASMLGDEFEIIEEGLPSRTIGLDDPRPNKEGRNGSLYFRPCLESHVPIDILVLWLGTNNTKDMFDQSPQETVQNLRNMLSSVRDILSKYGTKVVLLSPPKLDSQKAAEHYARADSKLEQLSGLYAELAQEFDASFINMYEILDMPVIADGVHLSKEQNKQVADVIFAKIKEIT